METFIDNDMIKRREKINPYKFDICKFCFDTSLFSENLTKAIDYSFLKTYNVSNMGYVYYKTGSLKLTMLLHFTNNTFSLVLCNVDALKDMESWRDVMPESLYWVSVVGCVLLTLLIARRFRAIKAAF